MDIHIHTGLNPHTPRCQASGNTVWGCRVHGLPAKVPFWLQAGVSGVGGRVRFRTDGPESVR